jgi:hypothetical protein
MAMPKRRVQMIVFHAAMFIIIGFIFYISKEYIADFIDDNDLIASILFVAILALPVYLHLTFFTKRRKK